MSAHVARLLLALLSLLPPLRFGRCVARRHDAIVAAVAHASERAGIDPSLLLVTGLLESALGCDPRSAGGFGNAASARHRDRPGSVDGAARILATGLRRCGSEIGAASYWRCGRCHCPPLVGYEPRDATALIAHLRMRVAAVGGGPE